VKVSRWLIEEIEKFINNSKKNKTEFPSKRNLVDIALIKFLQNKGVKL
tara:strand:+ start:1201 stop:1344 length:144 start_codon:yes stop_codon:yes gene_type:complete